MPLKRFQFSLRSLVIVTLVSAVVFSFSVGLPIGQFPFEQWESHPRAPTLIETARRIAIFFLLIPIEVAGIWLLVSHYRKVKKYRRESKL